MLSSASTLAAVREVPASNHAYSSLQVKFAAWPTSWRPHGAERLSLKRPKVNSRTWLRLAYCYYYYYYYYRHFWNSL